MQNLILNHQVVAVIDFGGQYSQLIARRIRELGSYSELVAWQKADEYLATQRPDAVILSGGPSSVIGPNAPVISAALLAGIPTLGICYGQQFVAHAFGGQVVGCDDREYGRTHLKTATGFLDGWSGEQIWMSHGDQVIEVPPGFTIAASTDSCPVAAMFSAEAQIYCVQFHPEVTHTPRGTELLSFFVKEVAKLKGDWTAASFLDDQVKALRARVGQRRILCATSGGVDSSVVAALLCRAFESQVTCVFVDHGLLRYRESEYVREQFSGHFHPKLVVIDARDRFLSALQGVTDPEQKRKIIGELFTVVFDEHADEIGDCEFLAQGTIYPDVIESGSSTAAKIKSHHNVGGLPAWFKEKFTIVEPLKWLFKDEVRKLGYELGLPAEMVDRHPFPGPGIAVRIVGEVTAERVRIVQEADHIFQQEIRKAGLYAEIWQAYAALLDVQTVGVMGDERTYQHPIVLRAVQSTDAMTASAYPFPFEVLEKVANRIVNEVKGVNRVFYDLTSKPPATIEME